MANYSLSFCLGNDHFLQESVNLSLKRWQSHAKSATSARGTAEAATSAGGTASAAAAVAAAVAAVAAVAPVATIKKSSK